MSKLSKCPVCNKPTSEENKPFCSKRCKDVDLARWFRGDYSLPVVEGEDTPDDEDNDGENIH